MILTKDNLLKRNRNGCKKCVFCQTDETIEHLFLSCSMARNIWRLLHFTFNVAPPSNIDNLFGTWLTGIDKRTKNCIRTGVCAFIWAIWNCRNDVVFNKIANAHFLQVVNKATY